MNLVDFINSRHRNQWIMEPGLEYYVRKSHRHAGMIELANCNATGTEQFAYFKFLKRYEHYIPFYAEQVINPDLAKLYRLRRWLESDHGGIPHFMSPLAVRRFLS